MLRLKRNKKKESLFFVLKMSKTQLSIECEFLLLFRTQLENVFG